MTRTPAASPVGRGATSRRSSIPYAWPSVRGSSAAAGRARGAGPGGSSAPWRCARRAGRRRSGRSPGPASRAHLLARQTSAAACRPAGASPDALYGPSVADRSHAAEQVTGICKGSSRRRAECSGLPTFTRGNGAGAASGTPSTARCSRSPSSSPRRSRAPGVRQHRRERGDVEQAPSTCEDADPRRARRRPRAARPSAARCRGGSCPGEHLAPVGRRRARRSAPVSSPGSSSLGLSGPDTIPPETTLRSGRVTGRAGPPGRRRRGRSGERSRGRPSRRRSTRRPPSRRRRA